MGSKRMGAVAVCHYGNASVLLLLAVYTFLIPGVIILGNLFDPAVRGDGIPACAFRWHRALSPRYERWARRRVACGSAERLDPGDNKSTEWPPFGSVLYLWATESLQEAWERDNRLSPRAPRDYTRGAIEAAAALVTDPKHAAWVKNLWGEDYLQRQNFFHRMLLIGALGSQLKLLGNSADNTLLWEQVESLSKELDESPRGLLDDYPGECYPGDVVGGIASIQRAGLVLGIDTSVFVERAIRGFRVRTSSTADAIELPPYSADHRDGCVIEPARGSTSSFLLAFAPELWEENARKWYADYEGRFWQKNWVAAGFREFPKEQAGRDWYVDVDSGPVVAGLGVSASAFGLAAARANGRFDHAFPLAAEMIAFCWPLLDGTLVVPRVLSDSVDAPYLGEAAILFCLTRRTVGGLPEIRGGSLPGCVYMMLAGYFGAGLVLAPIAVLEFRSWGRKVREQSVPFLRLQVAIWAMLVGGGAVVGFVWNMGIGVIALLCARLLPRWRKEPPLTPGETPR